MTTEKEEVEAPPSSAALSRSSTQASNIDRPPTIPTEKEKENSEVDRPISQTPTRSKSKELSLTRTCSATAPPTFTTLQEIGFISIICLAQLLAQATLAQTVAPLHVIAPSFDTSNAGQLSWLTAAFSLTIGTFILPAGRWGDLYGYRLLFFIGYIWLAVWSLVAGFAVYSHNLIFFAVCRAMQGIGPAMLIPNGLAILGRTYPPGQKKNMAFSLFGATAPGGFVLGALFSGIFSELVWWPWTFWVAGIIIGLFGISVLFLVPSIPVIGDKPKIAELDLVGTFLGVSGLILFNFAWNQGPVVGWDVVYVYVLFIVGCLSLGLFVWWELKMTDYPLLPTSAFSRDTSLVLLCIALGWASFGIWMYYSWQFIELLRGSSILLATAQFSPVLVMGAFAAISTGHLLDTLGPGLVMLVAMLAFCTSNILMATAPVHQSYWAQFFVSVVVAPFGMDMSFPAGSIILSNHMPRELQGIAASILCVIQNYWISIGLGMAGTVEVHVSGGDLLKGYRGAWYLAIGLTGLGIVFALALVFSWRSTVKAKQKAGEKVTIEEG